MPEVKQRRARRTKRSIEDAWYDAWKRWSREDRAVAIKVLERLHQMLPDSPTREQAEQTEIDLTGLGR